MAEALPAPAPCVAAACSSAGSRTRFARWRAVKAPKTTITTISATTSHSVSSSKIAWIT